VAVWLWLLTIAACVCPLSFLNPDAAAFWVKADIRDSSYSGAVYVGNDNVGRDAFDTAFAVFRVYPEDVLGVVPEEDVLLLLPVADGYPELRMSSTDFVE
jgi:hypothetical protein